VLRCATKKLDLSKAPAGVGEGPAAVAEIRSTESD
jgi:hypothetical protein